MAIVLFVTYSAFCFWAIFMRGVEVIDQFIISGRLKSSALPEFGSLPVDGVDHQCPPTDQRCGLNAPLEGVLHKASPDTQPGRADIGRELTKQHAGNWIRRLSRPDGAR